MKTGSVPYFTMSALGLLMIAMIVVVFGNETGYLDPFVSKRAVGVILGLVLIFSANAIPKLHWLGTSENPAQLRSAERFAGWMLVLGGIASGLVWVFAPIDLVLWLGPLTGLSAFAIVLLNTLRVSRSTMVGRSIPKPVFALSLIMLSVAWAMAIFIVDNIWGDQVSQWAAIIFVMVLVFVTSLWTMKNKQN